MEYKIVYGETIERLASEVNVQLAQGWRPQGGVYIEMGIMYQALIKGE